MGDERVVRETTSLGLAGRLLLVVVLVVGSVLASSDPFTLLFFLTYALVGAFLVVRKPRNAIGWLTVAIAIGLIGTTSSPDWDLAALQAGTASLGDSLGAWISSWAGSATFLGLAAMTIIFPSGHLPVGRWRLPAIGIIAAGLFIVVLTAATPTMAFDPGGGAGGVVVPNPFAIFPDLSAWDLVPVDGSMTVPIVVILVISVGAMIVRYRRSDGLLRLQLRWLVAAIAFVAFAVFVGLGTLVVFGDDVGGVAWIPAIIALPTVPIAIGVAVLRYRLYEIDRIISRTIGWAIVTSALVVVFAFLIVGLTTVLEPLIGGDAVAVAGSTLLVASLFAPLRGRVQRTVDRRFDRSRYDSERLLAAFGERLRDEVDIATISRDTRSAADAAVRPSTVGLWLRGVPSDTT